MPIRFMRDTDVDYDDGITAKVPIPVTIVACSWQGQETPAGEVVVSRVAPGWLLDGSRGRGGRCSHTAPPWSRGLHSNPNSCVSASGAVGVAAAAPTAAELTQAGGSGAPPNLLDDEDDDEDESEAFRLEVRRCLSGLQAENTKQAYNTYFGKFLEWAELKQPDS